MSKSATARGHWTKGKRRNADSGNWSRVRLLLQSLIDEHYEPGVVSARQLAADIGVSDRTVRRWLTGEDRPEPEMQAVVARWIVEKKPKRK